MLHTEVDPLLHVSVAHDLVDDHADGAGGDIVDDASSARRRQNEYRIEIQGGNGYTHGSIYGACPFAGRRWP
jgi:hypothetical protein